MGAHAGEPVDRGPPSAGAFVIRLDHPKGGEDYLQVWPLYDAVFGDQPDEETWRTAVWDRHTGREGFRLARAFDGDDLIGFAYGYTGDRGQWWTDRAIEVLPAATARAWLGGHFELVSIGVLPQARRRGIGRALLRRLTRDLPHERYLLMTTANQRDPARLLYAAEGWHAIGPGVGEDTVILAKGRPRQVSALVEGLTR